MITVRNIAVLLGALLPAVLAAPAPITKRDDIIPGKYIVTLKPGVDAAAADLTWVNDVHRRSFAKRDTVGIEKKYDIQDWKAYAGEFDEATIAEIKASADVSNDEQTHQRPPIADTELVWRLFQDALSWWPSVHSKIISSMLTTSRLRSLSLTLSLTSPSRLRRSSTASLRRRL
jgi:hypothetical protein